MKVSVMMLAYNHAEFIDQALTSAITQETDFPFEIVVGEDCSTDNTRNVLASIAAGHPDKVKPLIREKNLGMNRNFVDTWAHCRGEYVAFLEADDFWTSTQKLAKQVALMDAHPTASFCFARAQEVKEDGATNVRMIPPETHESWTLERLIKASYVPSCTVLYRRRSVEFPEWFYGLSLCDWPFHVMNAVHGEILFVDEPLAAYRLHEGGRWSQMAEEGRLIEELKFYEGIVQILPPRSEQVARSQMIARLHDLAHAKRKKGEMSSAARLFQRALAEERPNAKLPLRRKLRMRWRLRKWLAS